MRKLRRLRSSIGRVCVDFIQSLPLTVPSGLAAFGAVTVALLVLDSYHTWLVLPLGLIATVAAMFGAHRLASRIVMPGSKREQTVCNVLVATGVLFWLGINLPFTAQHIFTDRDPATYAVAGAWLATHDNLHIPAPTEYTSVPGVTAASLGFGQSTLDASEIYAQGAHILPAFLGITGRLAGYEVMLAANLLFGAAALLTIYGFGRLLMKPRWAVAATVAFAVSLPLLYFARDTYTEPMALTFIFGSLILLRHARQTGSYAGWVLAGLALGAGLLARIDTYLPVAALGVYFTFELCTVEAKQRMALLRRIGSCITAIAALGTLAWLDLTLLSSGYYRDLRPQYLAEIALVGAVVIMGIILVSLSWKTGLVNRLDRLTSPWRARTGLIALSLFFIFLASRSLWMTNYAMKNGTLVRSYAEHSLIWMSWYLGPAIALLGIIAIIWAWKCILEGKLLATLPFMCVMAACTMYLINPNISSDQVWASRRFLPVILPGLTILGFLLLERLYEQKTLRLPWLGGIDVHPQIIASSFASLALVGPLFVSLPFTITRTYAPQLSQVQFICNNIPANAVMAWVGEARAYSIQPTQAFCGVPSVGVESGDGLEEALDRLMVIGKREGTPIVIGVKNDDMAAIPERYRKAMTLENTIAYADVEQTYKKFPRNRVLHTQKLTLGALLPDTALADTNAPQTAN